jgi:hypothetical protein
MWDLDCHTSLVDHLWGNHHALGLSLGLLVLQGHTPLTLSAAGADGIRCHVRRKSDRPRPRSDLEPPALPPGIRLRLRPAKVRCRPVRTAGGGQGRAATAMAHQSFKEIRRRRATQALPDDNSGGGDKREEGVEGGREGEGRWPPGAAQRQPHLSGAQRGPEAGLKLGENFTSSASTPSRDAHSH